MLDSIDLSSLPDDRTRALVGGLLNLIETVMADLRTAQAENQRLRDELNHLKGEQGKPKIKPAVSPCRRVLQNRDRRLPTGRWGVFSAAEVALAHAVT